MIIGALVNGDNTEIKKGISPSIFVKNKLVALGIPCLMFSAIFICFNAVLQKYVQTNTVVSIKALSALIWKPVAQYWFIWVLVIYFIVVAYFGYTYRKLVILSAVGISLMEMLIPKTWADVYHNGLVYFFYFTTAAVLGCVFRQKNIEDININIYTIGILIISTNIFVHLNFYKNFLEETSIRTIILRLMGIVAFSIGIVFICKVSFIKKAFVKFGEYSWHIYLLHSYFLCFMRAVVKHFIPMGNQAIEVTMGMIFSVGGCMLIGFVSKRHMWMDVFFYPYHLKKSIKITEGDKDE